MKLILNFLALALLVSCATERGSLRRKEVKTEAPEGTQANQKKASPPVTYVARDVIDDIQAKELYESAVEAWRSSKRDLAIVRYNQYLESYPQGQYVDTSAMFLAQYWLRSRDPEKAIAPLMSLLALEPPSPNRDRALYLKAQAHYGLGQNQEALTTLESIEISRLSQ
ncbi:outer membrane protein assembly factor BamD, partial [bacterium]|nr:outer membrane protein assembly factor BamD [bacterium]